HGLFERIVTQPPDFTRSEWKASSDFRDICRKALAKEPRERYQSAQELAVDLQRFANGEILKYTTPPGVIGWVWHWARQRRLALVAAAAVLLLVTVGSAYVARWWHDWMSKDLTGRLNDLTLLDGHNARAESVLAVPQLNHLLL